MRHPFIPKTSLLVLFLCLSCFAYSQKKCETCPKEDLVTIENATVVNSDAGENDHPYGGTFQLICSKTLKSKELFTTDYLLPLVETKRSENEEVILQLSPNTKLRILSKKQISAPDFQPLKNLYSFE